MLTLLLNQLGILDIVRVPKLLPKRINDKEEIALDHRVDGVPDSFIVNVVSDDGIVGRSRVFGRRREVQLNHNRDQPNSEDGISDEKAQNFGAMSL